MNPRGLPSLWHVFCSYTPAHPFTPLEIKQNPQNYQGMENMHQDVAHHESTLEQSNL
ncbi:hypothetical protein FVEG_15169 [Fusarium verticillioides 7600]|uniref:Uncharacterized protein n=1 Tax=Gibberella moniliformis (strain M3125 / FGSC 7600) TaxID=334819 RepID=W7M737_GIBM7|nr:hypothetical protein FVEG_15169 [Fusarium verticillioides 7600]EWG40742.1 hypothetical protein FVEG_15169 [Fusarium verticillioides 7600]